MPVVGNPIIYLFCVTEYRSDATNIIIPILSPCLDIIHNNTHTVHIIKISFHFQKQHQKSLEGMYR